jgi:hypothetical protein
MIVAAHQWVMGTSDYFKVGSALRLAYFVLSGLFLLTSYSMARILLSPFYAFFVGTITALSFSTFLYPSDSLYAELPFALVSMLFLLFQQRSRSSLLYETMTGVCSILAYLLRTAGIVLLAAWVGASLIRRNFRQAAIRAGVIAVPILFWQMHTWRVINSDEYSHPVYSYQRAPYYYANVSYRENGSLIDPFRPELGRTNAAQLFGRIINNIESIPTSLGGSALVAPSYGPQFIDQVQHKTGLFLSQIWRTLSSRLIYAMLIGIGLLAIAGAVGVAFSRQWFLSLYFGLSLGLIAVTPWPGQFWRYLAPITPLTVVFLILALLAVRRFLTNRVIGSIGRVSSLVVAIPLAAVLLVQSMFAATLLKKAMYPVSYYDRDGQEHRLKLLAYESQWHSLDSTFEWLRRYAAPGAVIATTAPHLAYLRTGHKAVLPPFEANLDTASHLLDEVPVAYLVLDQFERPGISERYMAPIATGKTHDWGLVFTAPDGMTCVYERNR